MYMYICILNKSELVIDIVLFLLIRSSFVCLALIQFGFRFVCHDVVWVCQCPCCQTNLVLVIDDVVWK